MVFEGNMGVYSGEICEFEMDFKKSLCWRFNLSNHDIISAQRSGLKRVWILDATDNGCANDIVGLKQGQDFGEPGGTPLQEFLGVPSWSAY